MAANLATVIADLAAILTALSGAGSVSETTSASYTLTTSPATIGSQACKQITLYNASTTGANINYAVNGGANMILEPGYSVTFAASNLNKVTAYTAAGGENLYILWSA